MPEGVFGYILVGVWAVWMLQAGWCAYNVWSYLARSKRWESFHNARLNKFGVYTPPAVVIIPVKGADEHFAEHVRVVQQQSYPAYRVIFAVESEDDPACVALRDAPKPQDGGEPIAWGCRRVDVVVAGLAERGGQKVHNQLAAMDTLTDADEAVVFADADAMPHEHWLYYMVDILRRGDPVIAGTGYRWFVPADPSRPSLATSVGATINASVVTLMGQWWRTRAWGGSMSILRETIDAIDLRGHWDGALSDDYQLSRAVREAGKVVQLVPECVVESPVSFTWSSFYEFGRRQMRITRLHEPVGWWPGLLWTGLYTLAFVSAVVMSAVTLARLAGGVSPWWWVPPVSIGVVYVFDIVRGLLRKRVARVLLGDEAVAKLRRVWWVECLLTPLWMAVHCSLYLGSAVGTRLRWAGITYDIRGRTDVRILDRPYGPLRRN